MKLQFLKPPKSVLDAAGATVDRLETPRDSFLYAVRKLEVTEESSFHLAGPHPAFYASWTENGLFIPNDPQAWRFLILRGGFPVQYVEIPIQISDNSVPHAALGWVSLSKYGERFNEALSQLESQLGVIADLENASFELRCLEITVLQITAVWAHNRDRDYFFILGSAGTAKRSAMSDGQVLNQKEISAHLRSKFEALNPQSRTRWRR